MKRIPQAAVIGTGFIGPVHLEALRRLGYSVCGILGSSAEKSRLGAQAFGVSRGYADLAELTADPSIDVVHITSPNRDHYLQAKSCLLAGKHVVCEKPLAMTSAEARELVRLAQQCGRIAAVCYNVRYYPLCLEARERVSGGAIGSLFHVSGSYLQDWLLYDTDFNWRVRSEASGDLRAIADIGTHWMDLIQFITGSRIREVCADLRTIHAVRKAPRGSVQTFQKAEHLDTIPVPIQTEDYGSVLFRLENGASGAMTVSQVTAGRKNCIRFDLAGSTASLAWNSEEPNTLQIGYRHQSNHVLPRDPSLLSDQARPFCNYPGGHAEGFPDTFKQLFRCIYTAIEATETGAAAAPTIPYPTFADGLHEMLLCDAILKSHRERRWVTVEE